jgi:tetratricopeptide (TPR) repeat protein
MSKRFEMLQKLIAGGSKDPFHLYAFAMELKSLERYAEAMDAFGMLRDVDPKYVPQYLIAGGVAQQHLRDLPAARQWFEQGIERARAAGEEHALSELQQALAQLPG